MASITINTKRIIDNINKLSSFLSQHGITWSLITKMLCGNKEALEKILMDECMEGVYSIGDSRISNLKIIKGINRELRTLYLKPPAIKEVKNVIKYADVSLNTAFTTINELNKEAGRQGKIHDVVVMIEMGELREGIIRENILSFYGKVFELPHIRINALGTNLGCMYGVEPTFDKLIQLSLYKQLIEEKFGRKLPFVSAGSSITLPLISKQKVPKGVNHFRIGETAFLGNSLLEDKRFRNLSTTAFDFTGEIVELEKKASVPDGIISDANVGMTSQFENHEYEESYKAIVDFGQLDVDIRNLKPRDKSVKFVGTTSDMTVYDLGENKKKYKVGSQLHFIPNYMAIARLMNSRYITKVVV